MRHNPEFFQMKEIHPKKSFESIPLLVRQSDSRLSNPNPPSIQVSQGSSTVTREMHYGAIYHYLETVHDYYAQRRTINICMAGMLAGIFGFGIFSIISVFLLNSSKTAMATGGTSAILSLFFVLAVVCRNRNEHMMKKRTAVAFPSQIPSRSSFEERERLINASEQTSRRTSTSMASRFFDIFGYTSSDSPQSSRSSSKRPSPPLMRATP